MRYLGTRVKAVLSALLGRAEADFLNKDWWIAHRSL